MASIKKDRDQARIKLYRSLLLYSNLELCQGEQNFFDGVIEQFVQLVNLYFAAFLCCSIRLL